MAVAAQIANDKKQSSLVKRVGGVSADQLRSFITRVEKLREDQKGIGDDISAVFADAKAKGFCLKTMRRILKLRKIDIKQREEEELMLETYMNALGMLPLDAYGERKQ